MPHRTPDTRLEYVMARREVEKGERRVKEEILKEVGIYQEEDLRQGKE